MPSALRSKLRCRDRWLWSTRAIDGFAMYMFQTYIGEIFERSVNDYLAISHAGRGINSYGLNYHLVRGDIAIFTQDSFGGVYGDAEVDRKNIANTFNHITTLLRQLDEHPLPPKRPRLVIVWSAFRGVCAHTQLSLTAPPSEGGQADWEHRGPFSGMGWLPSRTADGESISWVDCEDLDALFRSAAECLR